MASSTLGHVTAANYTQSLLNEMKKFYKHVNQLNILLKETNNACKELKTLQQSLQSLSEDTTNLQINELDEMFIKSLQKKKICFVILGQNSLAQSIVINELLTRYLLPFEITNKLNEENWRFVRIKHGKIGGYTYQLVDSEFEVMSSEQLNKKFTFTTQGSKNFSTSSSSSLLSNITSPNRTAKQSVNNVPISGEKSQSTSFKDHQQHLHHQSASSSSLGSMLTSSNFTIPLDVLRLDESLQKAREQVELASSAAELSEAKRKLGIVEAVAENHAILEVTLDLKLLENNVEILMHSRSMNPSILDTLLADVIPVYVYAIIEGRMSPQDLKELNQLKPIIKNNPILFVKIPEVDKYIERTQQQQATSNSPPNSSSTQSNEAQSTKRANTFVKYLSQQSQQQHIDTSGLSSSNAFEIFKQLCELNYLNVLTTGGNSSSNQTTSNGVTSSSSFAMSDYFFGSGESAASYNYLVSDHQQQHSALTRDESTTSMTSINGANSNVSSTAASIRSWSIPSEFCEKWHLFMPQFCMFLKRYLKSYSVRGTTILFKFHEFCLSKFINFAFEMARDMLVTPRKIEYVREKEQILYESLLSLASMKQEELKNLINNAIETHREQILAECRAFQFVDVELINCTTAATTPSSSPIPISFSSVTSSVGASEIAPLSTTPEDDSTSSMLIVPSVSVSISEPMSTPRVARHSSSETETLSSAAAFDATSQYLTVRYARDYKKCTSQIQELVISRLNNAIGQKLIESVEILKENYLGTLKRCLITLEEMNNPLISSPNETNSASVSEALQQIINAAYHVELNLSGSSSFLKILILRMKELMKNMPWNASPKLDEEWKVLIASNMLNSLSESKLAKILCNQMKERLKTSHNLFTNSLKLLEAKHTGRLEKNEENQTLIRKILAPKFAKLCLESTSLRDYVLYGFPSLGREIGRGQYGVVYSCARWGRYDNLAVKSVVPPDEKHWNDLALEFHYTKQIADHERIVKLLGSVIDYTYGNGQSPAVLLIMEAMRRDLYSALKSGLDWKTRIRISVDVVNGIRYLHSLGLVHRDIKLKNVLLDEQNRAKITDLGFCKPEAMMSGSIVGTPVHMCPEMFNSKYDNTVDIYAFGILFWYICSGAVTLPRNFESCGTKDDLWSAVKRGVRPERLPNFDDQCWSLMEMCWQHDPKMRPHIGVVYDLLMAINTRYNA